jgi:L-ascorbate metabolism protein UlaG (beta-lactamase superfamily)
MLIGAPSPLNVAPHRGRFAAHGKATSSALKNHARVRKILMGRAAMIFRLLSAIAAACLLFASSANAQGKVELQWFGQAAFKLTTPSGKVIMIDPWIMGNPKTPAELKDLDKLGKIDVIFVTHGHGDHLGDAVELAKKNNAPVWGPAGMDQQLLTLGVLPANLAPRFGKGGTIEPFPGVKVTAVHAEHSSEMILKDASGKDVSYPAGEPVGFIFELENGFKIYHMGDTALFGDMKMYGEKYKPDLLLIPIGGHFVMDPKDAAIATKMISPKIAMPMHYGTIPQLKGTPAEYKAALGRTSIKILDTKPGDKMTF